MRLSKLSPSQRVKGRWLLYLEDGRILRVGEEAVVSFGLYAGMDLSEPQLAELDRGARESRLREKALRALSARPLSRKELLQKLTRPPRKKGEDGAEEAGPTPAEAEAVADWLERLGYLNDETYAAAVARHYAAKGYGHRRIQDELFRRGVPREYWETALAQDEAGDGEEAERINALIEKKMRGADPDDRKALKRVSDALARRGYRWEDIKEGLDRYRADHRMDD
ncbi:regulatory protein RecX [Pseudoflavonifractor sp. 524-17]|uniref:regulatory protein RecX n=1 Tax=Pseudoflavonifractor sp. 524-17 TaxID=2304577 RepID=UPI00137A14B1|nr:regulatory protein RecX [Pseudoflavonifractor sp. 524-17]NCE65434.1 regulatory protein RecX [Pseudoflavonifractor sp. 524-17]